MTAFRVLLQLTIIAVCRAEIFFKSPSMGEVVDSGPYKIHAGDGGIVPTLGQFNDASWEVVLFTGNDTAPFDLWEYKLSGYQMTNPTTQSPSLNIRRNATMSLEDKFFFGYRSYLTSNESIWVTAYSDRFTLTNMNGSLPDNVIEANNNVNSTTAPKRSISCGAKSGGACDQKVLESLGLGGDPASITSATATATSTVSVPGSTGSSAGTTSSKRTNGGVIAGIVLGSVAAVSIVIAAAVFLVMRAKKRKLSRGEILRNDVGLKDQETGALCERDTYGGGMKEDGVEDMGRRVELEGNRSYEMSTDLPRLVEMPERSASNSPDSLTINKSYLFLTYKVWSTLGTNNLSAKDNPDTSLAVTTCAVFAFVRRRLIHYREAATIPPTENKSHFIDQQTEDSLGLNTLSKLLDNPNYGIQETAAIIICERALHNDFTINSLLHDISQPDYDRREKAIRALVLIVNSSTVAPIHKPETYEALVKSLEYSVNDYEHHEYDPDWDNWYLRDIAEKSCLILIHELIRKHDVEELLKAGFIERWLVKEPWGGTTAKERSINFMDSLNKEYHLNMMILPLFNDGRGRKMLEEAKLLPASRHLVSEGSEDQDMEDVEGMLAERRPGGQSTAEEHLRRRHREAMVLNDGDLWNEGYPLAQRSFRKQSVSTWNVRRVVVHQFTGFTSKLSESSSSRFRVSKGSAIGDLNIARA
ncbi:hypothetical protein SBOR_1631 [Sclerotinia borealis F-4128]|uniref:Uncharacterized protein n=1 Tax=Sclerotinia borealis (strain F-4128) TaxID=1432307 RepID=W9CTX7_SCLBF|nr:hypothetical protein SBOR_1631 [Sclerotinia borealis F-4128]